MPKLCGGFINFADKFKIMRDQLDAIKDRFEEVGQLLVQPDAMADMKKYSKLSKEYKDLTPILMNEYDYDEGTEKFHIRKNMKFKTKILL